MGKNIIEKMIHNITSSFLDEVERTVSKEISKTKPKRNNNKVIKKEKDGKNIIDEIAKYLD